MISPEQRALGVPGDLLVTLQNKYLSLYATYIEHDKLEGSSTIDGELDDVGGFSVSIVISVMADKTNPTLPWCYLVTPLSMGWNWLASNRFEIVASPVRDEP
jgi:hypothetical protein